MAFDLKITFTGMILYVPARERLHVLMPRTPDTPAGSGRGGDCLDPHAARLTFDSAYGRPGAQVLDGALAHVSLRQRRLDFPTVGSAYVRGIPAAVAAVPSPLRQEVLEGGADEFLDARVTVCSGQATRTCPGECWEYLGELRRMSHRVDWSIRELDCDYLDLSLTDLAGLGTAGSVPRLYPIGGRIDLQVWHVPAYELPPDPAVAEAPADGTPNHRMAHLGVLLEGGVFSAPLFRPGQCGPVQGAAPAVPGAASLECIGAQWPGDPPAAGNASPSSRTGARVPVDP